MRDGDVADAGGGCQGLRVAQDAGAGGGVAGMPYGAVAGERLDGGLIENLCDESHALVQFDALAVGNGDSGALLSAMLQCEQAEKRDAGHFLARSEDTENAALFFGAVVQTQADF